MAKLSPEALARIAEALPDDYETNPDQFASDWASAQAARQEVERLRPVNDWYRESYQPWFQAYGGDFKEFEAWKQRGAAPEPEPVPLTAPASGINFDSEGALRQVYDHFDTQLADLRQEQASRDAVTQATIQSRSEELQRLLALQEQAYGIVNEAVYNKIEPGWRPNVDIPKVVEYAQRENIPDLRRAYAGYTQADREAALAQQAYERGLEEGRRALAAQSVTTEMGGGTPFRTAAEGGAARGYGNVGVEAILAGAQARAARRGVA